jgi:hypothetical protein
MSGITIPILLDFSECRPIVAHYLNYSINSPYLAIDSSLSNTLVNATHFKIYVVVRQMPSYSFTGTYILQSVLTGPFNTSFATIPQVNIQVSASTILQIPSSQLPVINNVYLFICRLVMVG